MSNEPEQPQWISTDTVRHPLNVLMMHDARQREMRLRVVDLSRSAGAISVMVAGTGLMLLGHSYSERLVDGKLEQRDITPDQAFEHIFGCTYKDMESLLSLKPSPLSTSDTGEAAATEPEVRGDE